MSQTTWKAGDTCTIKPDSRHGIGKADCGRLWTVSSMDPKEAGVHNGAPGVVDPTAAGTTIWAMVPLSCLLPAGDARPTVAAKMGAEVLRLRARVAELEAAQRWRVTAEELPPERATVVGYGGVGYQDPITVMLVGGEWYAAFHQKAWMAGIDGVNRAPKWWMPVTSAGSDK